MVDVGWARNCFLFCAIKSFMTPKSLEHKNVSTYNFALWMSYYEVIKPLEHKSKPLKPKTLFGKKNKNGNHTKSSITSIVMEVRYDTLK